MKILKYQKGKGNEYKIVTDKGEYKLYDDIIIKYQILLKKEIDEKEFQDILQENNLLKAYYEALKFISVRLRVEKEVREFLKKKNYNNKEINYAIKRLNEDNYLDHKTYIEAYIHDMLNLYLVGSNKILNDLVKLGFKEDEITPFLEQIDSKIYQDKIKKYVEKKARVNKRSASDFKRRTLMELMNKGFNKGDIEGVLDSILVEDDPEEIKKLVTKLYNKYSKKYDQNTTKLKIKNYLYQKGYKINDSDIL